MTWPRRSPCTNPRAASRRGRAERVPRAVGDADGSRSRRARRRSSSVARRARPGDSSGSRSSAPTSARGRAARWAAHHAERAERRAVACEKAGNDRVERSLAARDHVRMIAREREVRRRDSAGLCRYGNDDTGTEAHVVRLDERYDHAVRVGGAQVHGATARRFARSEILRARRVDQRARCAR